jgi:hypothetical protein
MESLLLNLAASLLFCWFLAAPLAGALVVAFGALVGRLAIGFALFCLGVIALAVWIRILLVRAR